MCVCVFDKFRTITKSIKFDWFFFIEKKKTFRSCSNLIEIKQSHLKDRLCVDMVQLQSVTYGTDNKKCEILDIRCQGKLNANIS